MQCEAAPAQMRSLAFFSDFTPLSRLLKVCSRVGCIRKGCSWNAHIRHATWVQGPQDPTAARRGGRRAGRWAPGGQPDEQRDSVARTWVLEADRFDLNKDSSAYLSVTLNKLNFLMAQFPYLYYTHLKRAFLCSSKNNEITMKRCTQGKVKNKQTNKQQIFNPIYVNLNIYTRIGLYKHLLLDIHQTYQITSWKNISGTVKTFYFSVGFEFLQ